MNQSGKDKDKFKRYLLIAAGLLTLSIIIALLPWLYKFHNSTLSADPAIWGVFGDYIGGVLSTLISALGFIGIILTIHIQANAISAQVSGIAQEKEIRDDEIFSKQALECLNEALTNLNDPETGGVYRNRLAWLESARLILTAQELSKNIKSSSVQQVYNAAEKVVRSKLSAKLNPDRYPETMQPSFFYDMDWDRWMDGKKQAPIDATSAYVIYKFISWQKHEADNISSLRGEVDANMISPKYLGAQLFIQQKIGS